MGLLRVSYNWATLADSTTLFFIQEPFPINFPLLLSWLEFTSVTFRDTWKTVGKEKIDVLVNSIPEDDVGFPSFKVSCEFLLNYYYFYLMWYILFFFFTDCVATLPREATNHSSWIFGQTIRSCSFKNSSNFFYCCCLPPAWHVP